MDQTRESRRGPEDVVMGAARDRADAITEEERRAGLAGVQSMSLQRLLAAIGTDAHVASLAIRARPGEVGEMLELAMSTQRATALVLLAATRFEIVRDAGDRDAIVRSVARIDGAHAHAIKEAMLAILRDTDRPAYQRLLATMDVKQVEDARRDPQSGKLLANYVDRPDECANQLIADADHADLLARDCKLVALAVENVPGAAGRLLDALARSQDPRAMTVRLEVVKSLSRAVRQDVARVERGEIAHDEPYRHAERIVPVLAEAMLEPKMAKKLLTMQSRGEAGELELRGLLHVCLFRGWSATLRSQVARSAARGAASMFEESLNQGDEVDRRGESVRTAQLMATVAAVQADELDTKFEKAALAFLKDMADFIPEAEGLETAGKVIKAVAIFGEPKEPDALWTRTAVDQIMRRVYERQNPVPASVKSPDAVEHYENAYADWAATPLATYTTILSEQK